MFSLLPYLVAIIGATSVGLFLFFIITQVQEKSAARDTLRQLEGYEIERERDRDLLMPAKERLLGPAVASLTKVGGRFNPPNFVESVRVKHIQAGINTAGAVEKFLAVRILGFILAPIVVIFALFFPLPLPGWGRFLLAGLGAAALVFLPSSNLNKKVQTREKLVRRQLPDVLDLLVICVEAGLGFEQAVDRVIMNVPGELSNEFARVMGETAAGSSRSDALRGLQERVDIEEIRSFVLAMIQADTFGISIGRVLRSQADDMRIKRRQLAQEKAQKSPIKMMIPMVFCIFPALFVVIIGPAIIKIINGGF